MYNLASKLLTPLCDPLALAILLLVCALLTWKHRRLAMRLLIVAVVLLLAFSSKFVSGALVRSLEDQYQDSGLDVPPAQAIVVLGGTIRMPTTRHHLTGLIDPSDRLLVAFRLYRSGKAPLVFCTGGRNPLGGKGRTPESVWMARLLEEWNVPSTAIQIEGGSINTHENAILSFQMLAPLGIPQDPPGDLRYAHASCGGSFSQSGVRGNRGAGRLPLRLGRRLPDGEMAAQRQEPGRLRRGLVRVAGDCHIPPAGLDVTGACDWENRHTRQHRRDGQRGRRRRLLPIDSILADGTGRGV